MREFFWDFLRRGLPVTTAVLGGLWAADKRMNVIPAAAVVAASWAAGRGVDYVVSRAFEPPMEQVPMLSLSPQEVVDNKGDPMSADDAIAAIKDKIDDTPETTEKAEA